MAETSSGLIEFLRALDPDNADDPNLTGDVDLVDGGFIDSFGMVELIGYIQKEYGVDLSGADFYDPKMRTVDGIAAAIEEQLNAA
jgi:acyl carrier protein